jgi:hypothetical protein
MKTKAIFIPVDYRKPVEIVTIDGLDSIQNLVSVSGCLQPSGYVQGLPVFGFDLSDKTDLFIIYVNEEGRCKGLPPNKRADNIISRFANGKGYLYDGGIVGNVVLSCLNEEGDELDVPAYICTALIKD